MERTILLWIFIAGIGMAAFGACAGGGETIGDTATSSNNAGPCEAPLKSCYDQCVDLELDPKHCGACGQACPEGDLCSVGSCGLVCQGGTTQCGDRCVTTATDPEHCGGCGFACDPGSLCIDGECSFECVGGTTACGNGCVDTNVDPLHCGGCDQACAEGQVCSNGTCALFCGTGTTECDGLCVDINTNEKHCGQCDMPCGATELCTEGICCALGMANCSGQCSDVLSDPNNCGSCGMMCPANETCIAGQCAEAGSCLDIKTSTPTATSGIYQVDSDGQGGGAAISVYCDMDIDSGGWTLMAKFTNVDAANWYPSNTNWVDNTTFGDATDITTNADAKGEAFLQVAVDEILIVHAPSTVEVQTHTVCLSGNTFSWLFQRDSVNGGNCAYSCTTKTLAGPWVGNTSYMDDVLKFRCTDSLSSTLNVGGYQMHTDDNCFVTTIQGQYTNLYNFGFGAGYSPSTYADFDGTYNDAADASDTTLRLMYGR